MKKAQCLVEEKIAAMSILPNNLKVYSIGSGHNANEYTMDTKNMTTLAYFW